MTTDENPPAFSRPAASPSAPSATTVGRQIPGFEMLGLLGRGGMGVVYQARHEELNRIVAIKMIRSAEDAGSEELIRFKIEAETVARLQHENIVQLFQIGETDGLPFLAFEYVDGGSLAQRIAGTPQPIDESVQVVEILARAVHHAHNHGIVHRDLKPANVLLTAAGIPKIADFGLALQQERAGQAMSGAIRGTPAYMAPEQAWGSTGLETIGPAADVYALGVILYEMLVGKPPFQAGTAREMLEQVWAGNPRPPRELRSEIPPDLEIICLRCLHKETAGRYASAEALAEDLRRFRQHEPITARSISRLERTRLWCRRKPYEAFLICALAVSLVVGIVGIAVKWYEADNNWKTAQANLLTANEAKKTAEAAEGRARVAEMSAVRDRDAAIENLYAFLVLGATRSLADGNRRAAEEYLRRCPPEQRHFEWELLLRQTLGSRLTLGGHRGQVTSTAFSADGHRLATSSTKDAVRLWNAQTGKQLAEIGGPARQIAFSPSGSELILLTHDLFGGSELQSWDIATGKKVKTHAVSIGRFALHPDGKLLAVHRSATKIELLGIPSWQTVATIDIDDAIASAAHRIDSIPLRRLSHDFGEPDYPVVAPTPGSIPKSTIKQKLDQSEPPRIEDASSLPHVPWQGDRARQGFAWSTDGRRLLIEFRQTRSKKEVDIEEATNDPEIRTSILVWNLQQKAAEFAVDLEDGDRVGGIATSRDGKTLFASILHRQSIRRSEQAATVGVASVLRFDLKSERALTPFAIRPESQQRNKRSATTTRRPPRRGDRTPEHAIAPQLAISADGSRLAVTRGSDMVILDSQTGRQVALHQGHRQPIASVRFSPTGAYCATAGGADGTVKFWDVEHPASEPQLVSPRFVGDFKEPRRTAVSRDGRILAAANDDGTIRVYDFDDSVESQIKPLLRADVPSTTLSQNSNQPPDEIRLAPTQLPQQLVATALRWRDSSDRLVAVYSGRIVAEIDFASSPPLITVLFDVSQFEDDAPLPASRQLQLSPDGRYLLIRSQRDQQLNVSVRNIEARRRVASHSVELELAAEILAYFTHDSRCVVVENLSATDPVVIDLKSGLRTDRHVDQRHRYDPDSVSPDRRRIVRINKDGQMQLLAAATRRILVTDVNERKYYWAKFGPLNRRLLVSSQHGIEQFHFELAHSASRVP